MSQSKIQLFTPKHRAADNKAYGYVTDGVYEWSQRSYISDSDAVFTAPGIGTISMKNNLSWDGANSEAYLDDILVADFSTRNPMYARNDVRMCYGYIPFILQNTYATAIYDLGFLFYDDPSNRAAEAVAGAQGYTYYNFADQGSPASAYNVNACLEDGSKFHGYAADSASLYVIGVMAGPNWNLGSGTEANALRNLSGSTYWIGLPYASLTVAGGRVVLQPQQYQDARAWWDNDNNYQNLSELGMEINGYRIKHWRDGNWRSMTNPVFVNRGVTPAPAVTDSIRIPSNGCVWGYITITVTNNKSSKEDVGVGGANFRLDTHGKWTADDLAANTGVYKTGIIEPWNANGSTAIASRAWRYGLHVVAKKE